VSALQILLVSIIGVQSQLRLVNFAGNAIDRSRS
jgi:hypothetical protein